VVLVCVTFSLKFFLIIFIAHKWAEDGSIYRSWTELTRIFLSFNSTVQVRANEHIAALVVL
jgi:hypothetical protein